MGLTQEELELLITLREQNADVLDKVEHDLRNVGDAADDAGERGSNFFSNMMSSAGGFIAANVVGGLYNAFTGFVGGFLEEAGDAEAGAAQLEAVLRSTGNAAGMTKDEVLDLASSLSAANGLSQFSDDAVLAGENLLLTFTNIKEDVFPGATQIMVDMATVMKTDVSAQAIALGKALNDPIAGISALSRVGVTFTEEQKAMIKSMVEAGDVAGAQRIIMEELSREFGGSAAAAADTFQGRMVTMQERIAGVQETIGNALLPALNDLLGFIASPEVGAMLEGVGVQIAAGLTTVSEYITTQVVPAVQQAWADIGPTIMAVGQSIIDGLGVALDWITANWPAVQGALTGLAAFFAGSAVVSGVLSLGAAIATLANPITLVIAGVALLGAAWATDFGGIQTTTMQVWEQYLQPAFAEIGEWLSVAIPAAITVAKDYWENNLQPALEAVGTFIMQDVVPAIGAAVSWLGENIPHAIQAASNFFNNTLMPTVRTVQAFFNDHIAPILSSVGELIGTTLVVASELLTAAWENKLQPALEAVWDFISRNVMPILKVLGEVFAITLGPIIETFKKNTLDVLLAAWQGIVKAIDGVKKGIDGLISKMREMEIPDWLQRHSPSPLEQSLFGSAEGFQLATARAMGLGRVLDGMQLQTDTSGLISSLASPSLAMAGGSGSQGSPLVGVGSGITVTIGSINITAPVDTTFDKHALAYEIVRIIDEELS